MRKRWLSRRLADFSLLFMLQMWKSGVRNPTEPFSTHSGKLCRNSTQTWTNLLLRKEILMNTRHPLIFNLLEFSAKFTLSHILTQTPHSGFINVQRLCTCQSCPRHSPIQQSFSSSVFSSTYEQTTASLCRGSTLTNIKHIFSVGCWFLFKWIMYQPDQFFFHFTHVTKIFLTGIIPQWYYHKSKENQACKP